ncbi:ParB/RepB/Spo0J family partition protein [Streptomyces sp. NPDC023327]|uniref:ParB/RepB/Spo0J family partition protein n=1 Tax=Streptomyces sp. NPDC023327 TaxID=3157088 RepID=UPI0033DBBCD5
MLEDFGVPPTATETRTLVEARLHEVRSGEAVPETLRVEFRNRPIHVEVIDMPVAQLFHNPGTHRVRAQRDHDLGREEQLKKDPWSTASQDYLRSLLMAMPADPHKLDPAFEELRQSLKEHQQNEPGLITRDGVLVNGNTRCAALKDLGTQTIRVGVLPASCTWTDIHSVELSLQLRPDRRRKYSYINELIAKEEQIALGLPMAGVAQRFHTSTPALERDMWVLGVLRDLVARSKNGHFALRLMDFERAQERFAELYRVHTKEKAKNRERADVLLENRLSAIVLEFSKTDIRHIGADFQGRFLDQRLPESFKAAATPAPTTVAIPGLNRTVQAPGGEVAAARAVTNTLLKAKAVQVAEDTATGEQLEAAKDSIEKLHEVFEESIEFAGRDNRLRKKRQAAPDRVTDACKDLKQCITDLNMARGNNSLDEASFDDALLNLKEVMGRLAAEAGKSIQIPGEGLTWLISVVDERL